MTWVLLLLQLLPTLLKLIQMVREAIAKRPRDERAALRREMFALAKRHVHELSHQHAIADTGLHERITEQWGDLLVRIEGGMA